MKYPYHDGHGDEHTAHHPANCDACGSKLTGRCDKCGAEVESGHVTASEAIAQLVRLVCDDYINGILICEAIRNELTFNERAVKLFDLAQAIQGHGDGQQYTRQAIYERYCKMAERHEAMLPVFLPKVGTMSKNARHFSRPATMANQLSLFDTKAA